MPDASEFPADWYDDPKTGGRKYWDGERWTGDFRPPEDVAVATKDGKKKDADGVIVAGYIFAVLMPFVGFIIGLTQINKNRHGLWVVLASVAAFIGWWILILALAASSESEFQTGQYFHESVIALGFSG